MNTDAVGNVVCPGCEGRKQVHAHLNYGRGRGEWKDIDCIRCHGTGTITAEHAARMEAGKLLRADRQSRDMSLHEEAKRLGIKASELSAREMGFV